MQNRTFKEAMDDFDFWNGLLMGPNSVRLLKELAQELPLKPGMRVLDLGCGRGLTSMYIAEAYGATVFATDLWVDPTDNYERFRTFGLSESIYPIRAEAHELPYAREFFDAFVSVDAYHYFGTEKGYLETHILPLLKQKATIGVVIPGLQAEFADGVPEALRPFWQDDMHFHSAGWWSDFWSGGEILLQTARNMDAHEEAWRDWLRCDNPYAQRDIPMMEAEGGNWFASIMLLGEKR